jgi:multiple sugar transport system permease protein
MPATSASSSEAPGSGVGIEVYYAIRSRQTMKARFRAAKLALFSIPALIVLLAVLIFPLGYSLNSSFFRWSIARPFLGSIFVGLGNYANALTDPAFLRALFNTLLFTLLAVIIEVILGLGIAHLFIGDFPAKEFFQTVLFLPVVVTPVAVGVIWRILLQTDVGLVCYVLAHLSGRAITILSDPVAAFAAIVLIDVWQTTPFAFVMLLAALESLPRDPYEAAYLDGANWYQRLRYLTLPLLKPILMVVIVIRVMDAFRIFDTIYILTGGGPGDATESVSTYAYRVAFQYFNTGYASALSYLTLLLTAVLTLGSVLLFRSGRASAT